MIYKAISKDKAVLAACNVDNDPEAITNLYSQTAASNLYFIWARDGYLIENPEGFVTQPSLRLTQEEDDLL